MKTDDKTLIEALRILVNDIQSDDGVANACIAEAANRLAELTENKDTPNDAKGVLQDVIDMRNYLEEYLDSKQLNTIIESLEVVSKFEEFVFVPRQLPDDIAKNFDDLYSTNEFGESYSECPKRLYKAMIKAYEEGK